MESKSVQRFAETESLDVVSARINAIESVTRTTQQKSQTETSDVEVESQEATVTSRTSQESNTLHQVEASSVEKTYQESSQGTAQSESSDSDDMEVVVNTKCSVTFDASDGRSVETTVSAPLSSTNE